MTKDTLPPSEPVMGHRKRNLTEKAKQAAESQPRKKARTKGTPVTASTTTRNRTVSIEDVEDEDDLRRSPPPCNSKHILEGPDEDGDDDDDDNKMPPKKKARPMEGLGSQASKHTQNTAGKVSAARKRTVSIEDVEDEDDLRQSPPPRNRNHILEGPDEDNDSDIMEVDAPEEPAESAEAELSESNLTF